MSVATNFLPEGTWQLDPEASSLELAIRHLGVSTVRAQLRGLRGRVVQETTREVVAVITAEVATLDSGDARRDGFLGSPGFLDAEQHPTASFAWEGQPQETRKGWTLDGSLTIAGTTRPLTVAIERTGGDDDDVVRLTVKAELDRHDYGLRFPQAAGAGDAVVAKTVKLTGDLTLRG